MPLLTFDNLKTAITEITAHTTTDLLGRESDFINMIEGRMNRELRVRDMETAAGVPLSFTGSYNAGTGTLPVNYLEWLDATWSGGGRVSSLRYVESDSEEWRRKFRPFGDPALFTTLGVSLYVKPGSVSLPGAVTLTYYAAIPPIATNPAGNFITMRYPDTYLHGALMEAYLYLEEYEIAEKYKALYDADVAAIRGDADTGKISRRPQRQPEVQNIAEARNQATGGA